jgi:hypothetical protein
LRKDFWNEFGVESQQDAATCDGGDAKEFTTVKECGTHGDLTLNQIRPRARGLVQEEAIVTLNGVL